MLRFLFGLAVGALGAAAYLQRQAKGASAAEAGRPNASPLTVGRVNELAGAVNSPGAPTAINAGDGTPRRSGAATATDEDHAVPSDITRH